MRKISFVLAILSFILPGIALSLDMPKEMEEEVAQAIKNGRALYNGYLKGPATDQQIEQQAKKIEDFCDLKYRGYIVDQNVYFIGEPLSPDGFVFGRHYKVSDSGVSKSTITCFVAPAPPNDAVGAFTTHHLSDTPTEFHVFLSLKLKNPIYVITKVGYWKVQNGDIGLAGLP